MGGERRAGLLFRQRDPRHATLARRPARQSTALDYDPRRIGERENTGDVRGRDLAEAVTEHGIRRHAPRPPERGQAEVDAEHGVLRDRRVR